MDGEKNLIEEEINAKINAIKNIYKPKNENEEQEMRKQMKKGIFYLNPLYDSSKDCLPQTKITTFTDHYF